MSIYRRLLSKGISTQFVTFNPSRSIIARFPSHGSPSHSHCPAIGPSTPPSRSFHSRRSVSTTSDSERQGQQLNSENMSSDAAAATEAPKPVQDVPDSAKDSKVKAEKGKARSKESKNKEEKSGFQLKVPKGTKDWEGKDMILRDSIFSSITEVFKRHGGVTIDTPVFELKDILTGKYGEDSKLIYDLADQGGEHCSLRYDLTVPFARYLAMNTSIQNIKRFHLAKVYRRDQPAMTKGRMREFYQCDFDIAGVYDPMLPDAECLRIVKEVFDSLGWEDNYTIKLNHRKLLDGIFQVCGVPDDKIRSISSAVDKLDKMPWEDVRKEMTEEKGLAPEVADKVGEYVNLKGQDDLLSKLNDMAELSANASAKAGLEDMALLFRYLKTFGVMPRVSFDMSLARGLDYYTGVIYEVVTEGSAPDASAAAAGSEKKDEKKKGKKSSSSTTVAKDDDDRSNDPTIGVGSVAAGGRYDELVGMFSGRAVPCVGISFGVDRIFSITKARLERASQSSDSLLRRTDVDVYVMAFGGKGFDGLLDDRMGVITQLWDGGIKAEFMYKVKPKLPQQFKSAGDVPFAVILGESELADGMVKIKPMGVPDDHPEKDGVLVNRTELVDELRRKLREKESSANAVSGGLIQRLLALQTS